MAYIIIDIMLVLALIGFFMVYALKINISQSTQIRLTSLVVIAATLITGSVGIWNT